jgi:uncharacterized protein (TIGR02145 family)
MVDGKWSNDSRNSSAWGNEPTYGTNTTSGNTNNGGRGGGNHGICPPSWHIPTDAEWGELLNAMESISGTPTHNTGTGERGADAGARGKSTCMCSFGICNTDEIVSWTFDNTTSAWGTDFYGFRALPSGNRGYAGVVFAGRGAGANFWSSSASSNTFAWHRLFHYTRARVTRNYTNSFRSYGMSVRCIRNSD